MTTRTLAEIEADQLALEIEKARIALPHLDAALSALDGLTEAKAELTEAKAELTEARDGLPAGPGRDALGHLLSVLTNAPTVVRAQADRARALIAQADAATSPSSGNS